MIGQQQQVALAMLQQQHQLRTVRDSSRRYLCWNGPDGDDSSPYLCSAVVLEATRSYRIYIDPVRFRNGKMNERRV